MKSRFGNIVTTTCDIKNLYTHCKIDMYENVTKQFYYYNVAKNLKIPTNK
ncbi:MAG: hypothetical protein ACK5HL_00060 [Bacilli bacterium]